MRFLNVRSWTQQKLSDVAESAARSRSASAERVFIGFRAYCNVSADCPSENDLLVMADTATQIARLCDKTHLLNRRLVGARPWKHVADLSDLTFRFLCRSVEVRAIYFAGAIFKGSNIRVQKLLCVVAGDRKDFAVAEVRAGLRNLNKAISGVSA